MVSKLFLWLTRGSGARRRWLFRTLFEMIARASREQTAWTFMNYGFADPEGPNTANGLRPEEEAQRVCCRLYEKVSDPVPVSGKDVVEISCGRGGGAAFIARYKEPRTVTGIDIAQSAIGFCRRVHRLPNLRFVQGDAESLPLFDASCDIAINVEASFCYGDFQRFLREIHRVLRPGGYFLYADLRFGEELSGWYESLERSGLEMIENEDISRNVLHALDVDGDRRERELRRIAPWLARRAMGTFGGTRGTRIPQMLASGAMRYHRFVFAKPDGDATAESAIESPQARIPPGRTAADALVP